MKKSLLTLLVNSIILAMMAVTASANISYDDLHTIYAQYQPSSDKVDHVEELDVWIIPFRIPECAKRSYQLINGLRLSSFTNDDTELKLSLKTNYVTCKPDSSDDRGYITSSYKIDEFFKIDVTYDHGFFGFSEGAFKGKTQTLNNYRTWAFVDLLFDTQEVLDVLKTKKMVKFRYVFTPEYQVNFVWYIVFTMGENGKIKAQFIN